MIAQDWVKDAFYYKSTESPSELLPTEKCICFTFIYHCFFMMQIFNIINCRNTFEDGAQKGSNGKAGDLQFFRQIVLLICSCCRRGPQSSSASYSASPAASVEDVRDRLFSNKIWIICFALLCQLLIIQYGGRYLSYRTASLSMFEHLLALAIGFGSLLWTTLCKRVFAACRKDR